MADQRLSHLDLFSGIGGFSLGFERAGYRTVAYCEPDEFCRRVIRWNWPDAVIYHDIRDYRGVPLSGPLGSR